MSSKIIRSILGFWLFLSTFLWKHSWAETVNGWVVGTSIVSLALFGLSGYRRARYLNAALGVWLIASTLFLPRLGRGGHWNDLCVGVLVVVVGLVPELRDIRRHPAASG